MNFNQVNEDSFVDLFGTGTEEAKRPFSSTLQPDEGVDILGVNIIDTTTDTSTEQTTDIVTEQTTDSTENQNEDVDILGQNEDPEKKPGRKPKYDFSDIAGYFQDRFKNNTLIPIVDDETNQPIELKTPEDFDMVIQENINYKVDEIRKELEQSWTQSKSPAWQAVARYADYVDDPSELVPFLQGVNNIQGISNLDENNIDHAERIVRYQKQISGTPEDVIEEEIEALKSTDKLLSSAAKIKPAIVQREQQRLYQMQLEAERKEQEYWQMVESFAHKAKEAIEKPLFGKIKLPMEEKAEIFDLIGAPDQKTGGYGIYNEIDSLYERGDFETLREIALILKKKDKYLNYATQREVQRAANEFQKKARLATQPSSSSSGMDNPEYLTDQPVIRRTSFKPFNSK